MSTNTSDFKTVLIAGATGYLGEKIAHAFLDKKQFDVRILVRKANEKTDAMKAKGATVIEADFTNVEALKKATSSVDAVVSALSKEGMELQLNLIEAAAASGVKRFIPAEFGNDKVMTRGASPSTDFKYAARDLIEKLGLNYTYIMTHAFMEYLCSPLLGVDLKEHKVNTFGPDVVLSSIHTDDIARLVPEVLLNPNSKNTTVNLGTETFKWDDVIAQLEKLTGKTFTKTALTVEGLDAFLKHANDPFMAFGATMQKQIIIHKGGALDPLHNLTDPFYANVKPKITLHDCLVQATKH